MFDLALLASGWGGGKAAQYRKQSEFVEKRVRSGVWTVGCACAVAEAVGGVTPLGVPTSPLPFLGVLP